MSKTTTASVLERFPDDWHVIVELSRSNDDFRELCDHHAECVTLLTRLRSERHPDAERIAEYQLMAEELELEIQDAVSEAG